MCKSEYPYEDGAVYLVRQVEGWPSKIAVWNERDRVFYTFGDGWGFPPENLSQVIARIEYSLRPI